MAIQFNRGVATIAKNKSANKQGKFNLPSAYYGESKPRRRKASQRRQRKSVESASFGTLGQAVVDPMASLSSCYKLPIMREICNEVFVPWRNTPLTNSNIEQIADAVVQYWATTAYSLEEFEEDWQKLTVLMPEKSATCLDYLFSCVYVKCYEVLYGKDAEYTL